MPGDSFDKQVIQGIVINVLRELTSHGTPGPKA
jgi:hypothetical protein